jgi:hypothetical protein
MMEMSPKLTKCLQSRRNRKNELRLRDTFIYTLCFYPVSCCKCLQIWISRDIWRHFRDTCINIISVDFPAQVSLERWVPPIWRHFIGDTWSLSRPVEGSEARFSTTRSVSKLMYSRSISVSRMSLASHHMETLPTLAERTVL